MYLPTGAEKQKCIKIVKEVKKINDDSLIEQYVEKTLKIAYSIGGSYDDEIVLKRIVESL
jgi:hypothetical protein